MRPGAGPVMGGRLGSMLRQVSHMCPRVVHRPSYMATRQVEGVEEPV